ncbi:MAG: hypothetical protein AAF449_22375 [Myxococcota bacterium]
MADLPTQSDINVFGSLNEQSAVEHFLGKDLLQAELLFKNNFLCYQEDLMWMGPKAFCFYVQAAVNYLLGPDSDGDSDAVSSFLICVQFQYDDHAKHLRSITGFLINAMESIASRVDRYECDVDIYGDVGMKYRGVIERLQTYS